MLPAPILAPWAPARPLSYATGPVFTRASTAAERGPLITTNVPAADPFGGISPTGGFGGGQIGYNWQGWWNRRLVLGIEADIQGSGISDRQTDFNGFHYKSDLGYFGTIRGRVGYAVQQTLFYFTGGFAYGGLRKFSDAFGPQSFDGTAAGYTVGGGVEYKITPAWSVKGEFQYVNLRQNNVCGSGSCFNAPFNAVGQLFSKTLLRQANECRTVT
jgi:opacity protein-like surface antigen